MAQRDDANSSSRRIFLAWMMALPIAGRAAAQTEVQPPSGDPKAWPDEYDPGQKPNAKEKCWADEIDRPPSAQKEMSWRDEIDRPPYAKQKERCWTDEIIQNPT